MLPQAHGAAEPPAGTHRLDVRDAGGVGRPARRRRRGLPPGRGGRRRRDGRRPAGVRRPQRPRHRRAAGRDARRRRRPAGAGLLDGGLRRGPLRLPRARRPDPRRRAVGPRSRRATSTTTARPAAGRWAGSWSTRPRRLDPRSSYAASKVAQEHYASAWARQAGAAAVALRYHNVYGPGMPRDTPYSGVAAMFRSSLERGEAPQVFEDGGQMRDFVHVADVARANLAAIRAVADGATPALRGVQRLLGRPGLDPRRGRAGRRGHRPRRSRPR